MAATRRPALGLLDVAVVSDDVVGTIGLVGLELELELELEPLHDDPGSNCGVSESGPGGGVSWGLRLRLCKPEKETRGPKYDEM